jgi:hypothetical protein
MARRSPSQPDKPTVPGLRMFQFKFQWQARVRPLGKERGQGKRGNSLGGCPVSLPNTALKRLLLTDGRTAAFHCCQRRNRSREEW